jgi:hypothetical protein
LNPAPVPSTGLSRLFRGERKREDGGMKIEGEKVVEIEDEKLRGW